MLQIAQWLRNFRESSFSRRNSSFESFNRDPDGQRPSRLPSGINRKTIEEGKVPGLEKSRNPEIPITNFCNLQFAISTSKPPAPVALEGRLCLSGKPHEYKRSLVWLNLPDPAKLGIPRARWPPLSISILQR